MLTFALPTATLHEVFASSCHDPAGRRTDQAHFENDFGIDPLQLLRRERFDDRWNELLQLGDSCHELLP